MNELITVIIPTYNRAHCISESIDSVIAQTYENFELLIIDDKSTDNTKDIILEYSKNDSRIKYIKNNRTKGVSGARNTGIDNINGEYVAFLDSDDYWNKDHLSTSISILKKYNKLVSFTYWYFKVDNQLIEGCAACDNESNTFAAAEELKAKEYDDCFIFSNNFFEYALRTSFYCYHLNTMLIKKEILLAAGYLNENISVGEDDDLTLRILQEHEFCLIRKTYYYYNIGNEDSLYSFADRIELTEKIMNTDYDKSILDRKLIKRFTEKGRQNIKLANIKVKYIKRSKLNFDKKRCIRGYKDAASIRNFTIGYINRDRNKIVSLYFYLNSLKLKYSNLCLIFIIKLIFPKAFNKVKKVPISLW